MGKYNPEGPPISTGGNVPDPTANNDFVVAGPALTWIGRTLAQVKVILGLGSAAYTASTDYATLGANVFTGQQTFKETLDTIHDITDGAAFEIDPVNGNIQTITLGDNRTPAATNFAAGARIVLLKRTDDVGPWYVWDSVRGIIAGNDPYLLLNTTDAEVTNTDYIDPLNAGFTIVDNGLADGDYIGVAIS